MKRVALVGLTLLAGLAAQTGAAKPSGVFTVVGLRGDGVSRVDPIGLKPLGRSVAIPFPWGATALSPDRRTLAIGANNSGTVRLVDVQHMRTLADVHVASYVAEQLVWLSPRGFLWSTSRLLRAPG